MGSTNIEYYFEDLFEDAASVMFASNKANIEAFLKFQIEMLR